MSYRTLTVYRGSSRPDRDREMNLQIRSARPEDTGTIADFNEAMAAETEDLELDRERLLPGVRAVLKDPSKGFYLIAEADGRIAGQLMITFEWSDWRNGMFWWIQSVYVHPEYRKQGVFRRLYEEVLDRARAAPDVCGVRLYVERENHRAQKTYESLGMISRGYRFYEVDFVLGEP